MAFGPFIPRPPLESGPFDSLNQQRAEASPVVPAQQSPVAAAEPLIVGRGPVIRGLAGPFGFRAPPQPTSPFIPPQQSPFVSAQPIIPTRPALGGIVGAFGPFHGLNRTSSPPSGMKVRLSQQYAEVIESGTNNLVRLSQQYAEVLESGTNNKIRLSQQYLETVITFGTPPVKVKKEPPGQNKKQAQDQFTAAVQQRLATERRIGSRLNRRNTLNLYPEYVARRRDRVREIEQVHTIYRS